MVEPPKRNLDKMPIKFLLTRHSHSCANALVDIYKHRGILHKLVSVHRPISKFLYTDPELTKEGEIKATERGEKIYNTFIKPNTDGPLPEIYSSMLFRAKQTANFIRERINALIDEGSKKRIANIGLLPYVSEVGLGYDNKEDTKRLNILKACPFFIEQEYAKNPHIPSASAFQKFLPHMIECRKYENNLHTSGQPYIDAIIVSHGHFMKKLFKTLFNIKFPHGDIKNLDSILLTLSKGSDGTYFIREAQFHESGVNIDKSLEKLCNTGCDPKKFGGPPHMCKSLSTQKAGKRSARHTRRKSMKRQPRLTPLL